MTTVILACVDFSDMTEPVIERAAELAAVGDRSFHLLHVAAPEPDLVGYDDDPVANWSSDDRARELVDEQRILERHAESLGSRGFAVTPIIAMGPSAATIIAEAKRLGADVIVLGSHGHGGLYNLLMGSVAAELEKHSPVPLDIVPHAGV